MQAIPLQITRKICIQTIQLIIIIMIVLYKRQTVYNIILQEYTVN